jgi:processing peptidase subunit alpha
VIAGAGIDHDLLVRLTETKFSRPPAYSQTCPSDQDQKLNLKATYVGGYSYYQNSEHSELSHVYIGFKGLPIHHPDIYSLAIIQFLLGGGGSFSAGGPGKGMYSRFYTHVLNQHPEVDHCSAFHHIYTDTSLFGVSASFYHGTDNQNRILSYILQQLQLLLVAPVSEAELNRAKNQLNSSLVMALESQATEVEDLGRQVSCCQGSFDGLC